MKKECTLGELDEVLTELTEQELCLPDELMIEEEEGESAIFVSNIRILLPTLELELREGYCGTWQEDEEYYMADFDLTAIYQKDAAPEDYILWEQDSPIVALHNYTHLDMDALEALPCVIVDESAEVEE